MKWDRDPPSRYLVVGGDKRGREELWAKAVGVEGLFVDAAPPPREILVLRGCAPAGRLAAAIADEGAQTSLGILTLEMCEADRIEWWDLVDATVIAHRREAADPLSVDVVVGAGVADPERWAGAPESPRFRLLTDGDRPAGTCSRVDGLYRRPRMRARPPLLLVGCEPAGRLDTLRDPDRHERGWEFELRALDRAGRVMNSKSVDVEIQNAYPSVLGTALLDVAIRFTDAFQLLPTAARPVREASSTGAS